MMDAVLQLSSTVGIESACDVLGVARSSFYRQRPLLGPALIGSVSGAGRTAGSDSRIEFRRVRPSGAEF